MIAANEHAGVTSIHSCLAILCGVHLSVVFRMLCAVC